MGALTKIIQILNPQAGTLRETVLEDRPTTLPLFESRRGMRPQTLREAATTSEFPMLLRDGIRAIAFDSYAGTAVTWPQWVPSVPSDKQSEDWVEENMPGELPIVHEGNPYAEIKRELDRTLNIRNYKRGDIYTVTEEMIRFNKVGLIRMDAALYGRRAANTREQACFSVLTTAGNYTRNSTTGDNDVGANTADTQFSASGLNSALATLTTMKDRKSGSYLGVQPDTLIVTPLLEMAAKQLLLSPVLMGAGDTDAVLVYGTGTSNPFRGMVKNIIVSPRMGTTYQWALLEAKRALLLQEVEGFQIFQEQAGQIQYEGWFMYDTVRYKVRDWFGVGMLNDRFAYLSVDTTGPTVT